MDSDKPAKRVYKLVLTGGKIYSGISACLLLLLVVFC